MGRQSCRVVASGAASDLSGYATERHLESGLWQKNQLTKIFADECKEMI